MSSQERHGYHGVGGVVGPLRRSSVIVTKKKGLSFT